MFISPQSEEYSLPPTQQASEKPFMPCDKLKTLNWKATGELKSIKWL